MIEQSKHRQENNKEQFQGNGDDAMSNVMEKYATLDLQALMRKNGKIISSEEALKDVQPVDWGKDVLQGKKKVTVTRVKSEERN